MRSAAFSATTAGNAGSPEGRAVTTSGVGTWRKSCSRAAARYQLEDGVVIPHVLRHFLVMPFQRSRGGVESDDAARIKVVSAPVGGVQVRRGVSHAPIEEVEIGVVGAGHPCRAAAEAPTVAGPGFRAFLARRRDRVEAPSQ